MKGFVFLFLMFAPFTADEQERRNNAKVFSVSPTNGILEAREGDTPTKAILQISFTARYS